MSDSKCLCVNNLLTHCRIAPERSGVRVEAGGEPRNHLTHLTQGNTVIRKVRGLSLTCEKGVGNMSVI